MHSKNWLGKSHSSIGPTRVDSRYPFIYNIIDVPHYCHCPFRVCMSCMYNLIRNQNSTICESQSAYLTTPESPIWILNSTRRITDPYVQVRSFLHYYFMPGWHSKAGSYWIFPICKQYATKRRESDICIRFILDYSSSKSQNRVLYTQFCRSFNLIFDVPMGTYF